MFFWTWLLQTCFVFLLLINIAFKFLVARWSWFWRVNPPHPKSWTHANVLCCQSSNFSAFLLLNAMKTQILCRSVLVELVTKSVHLWKTPWNDPNDPKTYCLRLNMANILWHGYFRLLWGFFLVHLLMICVDQISCCKVKRDFGAE